MLEVEKRPAPHLVRHARFERLARLEINQQTGVVGLAFPLPIDVPGRDDGHTALDLLPGYLSTPVRNEASVATSGLPVVGLPWEAMASERCELWVLVA